MPQAPSRVLSWEGSFNARHLGGYLTDSATRTRRRSLVRSDNLRRLTPVGRAALLSYGATTVVDLRAPFELRIDPSPFASGPALPGTPAYLNIPLFDRDGPDSPTAAAIDAAPTLEAAYQLIIDRCRDQIASVIRAIASAPVGPVLFYCHAGKDRTGLIAALVLAIAGVRHRTIAQDYALSDTLLRPLYESQLHQQADPDKRATLAQHLSSPLNAAHPRTMLATLAYLQNQHDGPLSYLRAAGVEQSDLQCLRARMG